MNIAQIAAEHNISADVVRERWLALRAAMWKADFHLFAREALQIRTKTGELKPLILNEAQTILHDAAEEQLRQDGWVRAAGLKGRRQGFSTYVAARGYHRATLWDRQNIYILSHEMTSSNALFDMVSLMQDNHPFPPTVGTDNAKELEFIKRGSYYSVATAGQKAGGRGRAISFFHGSEAAWWTNAPDHFAASVQAVDEVRGKWGVLWRRPKNPLPFEARAPQEICGWVRAPSEVWLETTSAGPSGEFYQRYMKAQKRQGRYRAVFVPWTVQKEYIDPTPHTASAEPDEEGELSELEYQQLHDLSDEQMAWRASKTEELGSPALFRQEYPLDVQEAFAAADIDGIFIKPTLVLKARKRNIPDPDAPLIIGVDPAGSGGDRFAVAWRRGDKIIKVDYRNKLEHDTAVAWLAEIIDADKPNRMCIDRGSMGAAIVSSLRNQKRKYAEIVRGIDFGGKSKAKEVNPQRAGPWNKRAEIYGRLRDWLKNGVIPDDDDLASDMSAVLTKYRANNDWLLESKTEMKKRGIRSCDLSDACALTFSTTEFFDNWNKPKQVAGFNSGLSRIEAEGIGDNDGFYELELGNSDHGWMG